MRTLIIDNYDSFTYNLFQYLAEINGTEPIVVRNDAPGWRVDGSRRVRQRRHLSGTRATQPGIGLRLLPRRRARRADPAARCVPGPSRAMRAQRRSAAPRRNSSTAASRRSARRHGPVRGAAITVRVVRYHSLAVTRVSDELEVTAWTEDGVIMGVRHRDRPAWGVQFHPESIRTEHGMDLLDNFARLSREWRERNPARPRATQAGSRAA